MYKPRLLCFLFLILFITVATAQIPRTLSYQGILTDNAGKPRPDQDYPFTFCLYDTAIGGNPLWTEQKTLSVKGGLFSTILGDQKPFCAAVKFDKQYWLGIQVGSEAELAPRIRLTSVGYSLNAVRADTAKYSHNITAGTINGSLNIKGSDLSLGSEDGRLVGSYPSQRALVHDSGDVLAINYGEDFEGGVRIDGRIRVLGHLKTSTLEITGFDLNLGTDDGRFVGVRTSQRALVHDSGDVLAINYGEDFEGGTRIDGQLRVVGRIKTNILEITGSDFAEPFIISHADSLPVGSLVVIDPEHPGQLKQATESNDKRVAGVISGAGGIYPGIMVTKQDKSKHSQYVAMTGQVYALATAANGPIEPGDLLTTSSIPGHAMKATDHERAFGAVIGKAMSGLNDGEGLVLVLIQPH